MDLDETLYLRSSTEDFIDCAYPAVVAAVLMQGLDWIKPWRWSGGEATRDVWRVRLILLVFPWTLLRWRYRLPVLLHAYTNVPLADLIRRHRAMTVIVTMGFRCIVTPLIVRLQLGQSRIVAVRVSTCRDRLRGKLDLARDAVGASTVRRSLVLTDSLDDLALLDACRVPLRTRWPAARYRQALSAVYLPGRYLTRVKRPGERYIVRGILQEDFAFWLLASAGVALVPVMHSLGLLLLLMSFWTVYESGYVDNDRIAARYEAQPKLSATFATSTVPTPALQPWLWAAALAVAALALLRWPARAQAADLVVWMLLLVATRVWFALYNRLDKASRIWLFPGLQLARAAAFVVLVPIVPIASAALGAHVLAKWLPYYVYRLGVSGWPETRVCLTRLLFFVVLATLLGLSLGWAHTINTTSAALLAWNLYRARDELRATLRSAHRIDRYPTEPPA
ncbi:hypothetical protein SAMN04488068_2127 [Hydrocarboniphaga daqingensis]|uniref:Uncharacterized protein n=2 Tax=Hydrocarboniphaga daqingensis TaxID=490188 RepID=A0A1M5PAZ8_9GAMM|nr:hypothetical protein SAMN04488068_2127 [Hydrocarboniphaga daqingensis]